MFHKNLKKKIKTKYAKDCLKTNGVSCILIWNESTEKYIKEIAKKTKFQIIYFNGKLIILIYQSFLFDINDCAPKICIIDMKMNTGKYN